VSYSGSEVCYVPNIYISQILFYFAMLNSKYGKLLLPVVVLLVLTAKISPIYAQEGVSYYLGNIIRVESRDGVYATAYIHPLGISWSDWRQNYFDPNPDAYYNGLLNRLVFMLNLKRLSIAGYGVDDAKQIVYVTVLFALSDSGYYDSKLDCLSILDVFKNSGTGYFDKLEVYSRLRIYNVEPAATWRDSYSAVWENPSFGAAPLWYRIYLSPLMTVRVGVQGLPAGYRVSVYADGRKLGDLAAGESRDFLFKEGSYTLTVTPDIVEAGKDVRYKVRSPSFTVSSSGGVTFEYVKQVLVSFKAATGFERVRVDGSWYSTPTQLWLDAGLHELYAEPSVTKQVSGSEQVAYRFSRWVVGVSSYSSNPLSLQLSDPVTVSAEYIQRRDFRVVVRTRYAAPIDGWFGEGEVVRVSEPSERVEGDVKYVFAGWYSGGSLYSGSSELSLTVDRPVSLESRWEKWYKVVIACKPSAACASEELWFKEGATLDPASLGAEKVVYSGETRYVFQSWSSGPLSVVSPTTLYREYKVQHRVRVEPGEGRAWVEEGEWVDEGTVVTVRAESSRFGFPVQTVLEGFYAEGGSIVEQSVSAGWARVRVDAPTVVYVLWREDYTLLYAFLGLFIAAAGCVFLVARKRLPTAAEKVEVKAETVEMEVKPEEKPVTPLPEVKIVGPSEEIQVMSLEEVENELKRVEEEAERHREYLRRLETMKAEGRLSEATYEQLRREYINKLEMLETRIRELKYIEGKLRDRVEQP